MEIVEAILEVLNVWGTLLPRPFESKHGWSRRVKGINKTQFDRSIRHMKERGLVREVTQNGQRFIKITQKGELQALLSKARINMPKQKWDGKWRLIMFDIPENFDNKREAFRRLLKTNGFVKLQASVYISPYALNRSAIAYLKQTQLIDYIRILRVDEVDEDKVLRKHFKLS